jgi:hypothetical protein
MLTSYRFLIASVNRLSCESVIGASNRTPPSALRLEAWQSSNCFLLVIGYTPFPK